MGSNKSGTFKVALFMAVGTFFLAAFFSSVSELVMPKIQILLLSFLFLLLIILTGIVFDIIGIAAAVANEHPFHAKAAKKVFGASQAIKIVRNADRVASFCNDVVGDICGTVSGALGATIVLQMVTKNPTLSEAVLSVVMTSLIAAITVGGKSAGKTKAINDADAIVFRVGQSLAWLEKVTGGDFLSRKNNRKSNGKRG